jgi:hypothetical protein
VEINLDAILLNGSYLDSFVRQYVEYLAALQQRGVQFSLGSDCHSARYEPDLERASALLEPLGLRAEDLWRLPPRPGA